MSSQPDDKKSDENKHLDPEAVFERALSMPILPEGAEDPEKKQEAILAKNEEDTAKWSSSSGSTSDSSTDDSDFIVVPSLPSSGSETILAITVPLEEAAEYNLITEERLTTTDESLSEPPLDMFDYYIQQMKAICTSSEAQPEPNNGGGSAEVKKAGPKRGADDAVPPKDMGQKRPKLE